MSIMKEVNEKVKNIIINCCNLSNDEEIQMSTVFREDLNANQLDIMIIVCEVEKEFNITVDSLLLASGAIRTVADLCSLIEKKNK